jgi:gas vesicle protein
MPEEHRITEEVGELLKSLQTMAALISEAATETAQAAAVAGAQVTPDFLASPLAELANAVANFSESLTGPLRKLLAEQQRLADLMANWSEQHRRMSEQIATWADEHRRLTEQMQRLILPALEQTDSVSKTARIFSDELRH